MSDAWSIQLLPKSQGAAGENGHAKYGQRDHLRPKDGRSGAAEEDAADDFHEVAKRIQVGEPLHGCGMLLIGKEKPLSRNIGMNMKKKVIMACCCVREMVEINRPAPSVVIRNKAVQTSIARKLPRNGTWKTASARASHDGHLQHADQRKRQRLAQHEFERANRRDHELLHRSDFLFPNDAHCRQHDRYQSHNVHQHSRNKVDAAFEIRVEPNPLTNIQSGHSQLGRPAGSLSQRNQPLALLLLERLAGEASDNLTGIGTLPETRYSSWFRPRAPVRPLSGPG